MAQFILSGFADEAAGDLEGQIAALQRNGIPLLEPRSIDGGILDKTEDELKAIKARLDEAGIGISSLGSPIGKYKIENDFAPHQESFRKAIAACKLLGTHRMRMFSFFVAPEDYDKYRDEVHARMTWMLDEAEKEGILLCHENESKIYGESPARVKDLLDTHPRLKGIFDAANYVREGHDPLEGIAVTLPSLEYIHVKDARRTDRALMPCGTGDGQYEEVLSMVDKATDSTVILTLEPHLHIFSAYKKIDGHRLATGFTYDNSDVAFDDAANHLKNTLIKLGYHEENQIWKK